MKQYKNTVRKIQNTVNTRTRITKTPMPYKAHTLQKQVKTTTVHVKTNTVQDSPKLNSHNIIKYSQCKVILMHMARLSQSNSP